MIKNKGGFEIFDNPDWVDACSVLMTIDVSLDKFQKEYSKRADYYTFEEYAGRYRTERNPFTKTCRIAEQVFVKLIEDDVEADNSSQVFDTDQAEAAYCGFLVGLRVGEIACRRTAGTYIGAVKMKMLSLFENPEIFLGSQDLLASQSSNFLAKYLMKMPPRDYLAEHPVERGFDQSYAYQLGFLMPVSTAFELLIDPDTYYGLIDGYLDNVDHPDSRAIVELLDIAVLPSVE